jgi:hypothetical protein
MKPSLSHFGPSDEPDGVDVLHGIGVVALEDGSVVVSAGVVGAVEVSLGEVVVLAGNSVVVSAGVAGAVEVSLGEVVVLAGNSVVVSTGVVVIGAVEVTFDESVVPSVEVEVTGAVVVSFCGSVVPVDVGDMEVVVSPSGVGLIGAFEDSIGEVMPPGVVVIAD